MSDGELTAAKNIVRAYFFSPGIMSKPYACWPASASSATCLMTPKGCESVLELAPG